VLLVLKQYLGFILSKYVDMWLGILEADDLMLGVFFFFFFFLITKSTSCIIH
jgi:hypothetical protein